MEKNLMFTLHERLKADTFELTRLQLSRVLLMNDRSFPWLILVPEKDDLREIHDLQEKERSVLMEEIALASKVLKHLFQPDKINVGALGNLVPQLHIHVIGRTRSDRAWPAPVWGTGPAAPYPPEEKERVCERLREAFLNEQR